MAPLVSPAIAQSPMPPDAHRRPLRVAIIGGGVAGLSAAFDLTRGPTPADVTVYEAGATLGGLAAGFKGRPAWEWPLEHFYHHLFTNDDAIIGLTKELGLEHLLDIHRPTTVLHTHGRNYPFDTPMRLLQFPHLNLLDKLRMGAVLAFLKYWPAPPWRRFDRLLAGEWLARWMGRGGYEAVWGPMLDGKFGPYAPVVNLAWFWARIYKRTPQLAYYRGGFQAFVDGLAQRVEAQHGKLVTNARITSIRSAGESGDGRLIVEREGVSPQPFDAVICTTSPGLFERLAPQLPPAYLDRLQALTSIGAVVLTVALNRQLLTDGAYWVNLPKRDGFPFLALVEHTNMVDKAHYGGDHLLYLGDYLPADHRYFDYSVEQLVEEFTPYLSRFNPAFERSWITGAWVHKAKYAQPVPPVGYAEMIPDVRTPIPGLYFASMSQVYPWDRGTNYAVEMGRRVAGYVLDDCAALH